MQKMSKGFGWRLDFPDTRDFLYGAAPRALESLPEKVDLRDQCPPVYEQGGLNSCTANAVAAALEFDQIKEGATPVVPSRLFVYYNTRAAENTIESNTGTSIRDAIKSVAAEGACREDPTWPYDESRFKLRPSDASYAEAQQYQAIAYLRLQQTLPQLKGCLAEGYPFVFGFAVFSNFDTPQTRETGVLDMPPADNVRPEGHAVLAVGYDEAAQRFIVRNSWGPDWGQAGYYTMPYPYLLQESLSSDFWTIRKVETGEVETPKAVAA